MENESKEITIGKGDKAVKLVAPAHKFSTGTHGYYFRDRVVIDGVSYHVQITISAK